MATGSLATSIAAFPVGFLLTVTPLFWLGPLIPIVGVILGIAALNQIKATGRSGRGMAIAGIVIGAVALVMLILVLIVFVILIGAVLTESHS
jgi:Na+/H+-dicarboxylate symporter